MKTKVENVKVTMTKTDTDTDFLSLLFSKTTVNDLKLENFTLYKQLSNGLVQNEIILLPCNCGSVFL